MRLSSGTNRAPFQAHPRPPLSAASLIRGENSFLTPMRSCLVEHGRPAARPWVRARSVWTLFTRATLSWRPFPRSRLHATPARSCHGSRVPPLPFSLQFRIGFAPRVLSSQIRTAISRLRPPKILSQGCLACRGPSAQYDVEISYPCASVCIRGSNYGSSCVPG